MDTEVQCPPEKRDLLHACHEMAEAAPEYGKAKTYYEGTAPEFFATPRLRKRLANTGSHFRVNLAKTPVNVVADALNITSMTVTNNPAATAALAKIWADNEMDEEAPPLMRKTCEYGDSYLIVWPGDDSDDLSVELFYNGPKTVRIFYDEENSRVKTYAIKKFKDGNTVRVNLFYPDRIEKWVRAKSGEDDKPDDWYHYMDDDLDDDMVEGTGVWPLPNPYGVVPVFHFRTARPYGEPLHKDAYGPQDAVNKLVITEMSSVDYQGFPQRYALTDPGVDSDEETDFESNFLGDDAQATRSTTDTSSLRSGPGELWMMQGVKGVGQFNVADPKVFTDPLELMVRLMAQTTTTPLHYFDPSGDRPSGESLKVANEPRNKKVGAFQRSFGATWNQALTFALKIMGIDVPGIDIKWENPATVDDKDSWDTTQAKIDAGVPLRQALLEAGYDPEQLDEWGVGTGEAPTTAQRAAILTEIGKAAQALGAASGFGVVDLAQVKALIDSFFLSEVGPSAP